MKKRSDTKPWESNGYHLANVKKMLANENVNRKKSKQGLFCKEDMVIRAGGNLGDITSLMYFDTGRHNSSNIFETRRTDLKVTLLSGNITISHAKIVTKPPKSGEIITCQMPLIEVNKRANGEYLLSYVDIVHTINTKVKLMNNCPVIIPYDSFIDIDVASYATVLLLEEIGGIKSTSRKNLGWRVVREKPVSCLDELTFGRIRSGFDKTLTQNISFFLK